MKTLTAFTIIVGILIIVVSLLLDLPWLAFACIASITILAISTPSWRQIVYSVTIFLAIYAVLTIIANIGFVSENLLLSLATIELKFFACACASTVVAINVLILAFRARSRFVVQMFVAVRIAEELLRYIPTTMRIVEANYGISGIRKMMLVAKILIVHTISRCIEYYEALMNYLAQQEKRNTIDEKKSFDRN